MYEIKNLSKFHKIASLSVVIPVFNRENLISEAIESVLNQKDVVVEPIVVDDGSTDNTFKVASSYGDAVTVLSGTNYGVSSARNAGIFASKSPFIGFLDSDDLVENSFFSAAIEAASSRDASMIFGPWRIEKSNEIKLPKPIVDCQSLVESFMSLCPPCTGSILWNREFLLLIGVYNVNLSFSEDHELYFRALSHLPLTNTFTNACYIARDKPGLYRLTQLNERVLRDGLHALELIYQHLVSTNMEPENSLEFIRYRIYEIMRQAAKASLGEIFNLASSRYHEFGGRGHKGSALHILFSNLIGLQNKENLSSRLRNIVGIAK